MILTKQVKEIDYQEFKQVFIVKLTEYFKNKNQEMLIQLINISIQDLIIGMECY